MGGGFVSSHDQDSFSEEGFPLVSSHSPALIRDNLDKQNEDNRVNEDNKLDFEVNERKRLIAYQEILQSYDELKIHSKNLKEAKEKILSYRPGAWIEKVGGLKLSDYDIPNTTCLILVGPRGSGKSSLINRITKVLDDEKSAPARAQVSYNSLVGDGTYFLQEYMIPRHSTSISLCDTRSFSDNSHHENNRILRSWMTKGFRHGELVLRNTDDWRLRKSLKCKDRRKGYFPSTIRKVNFVIYVVNGLSVLRAMENTGALETQYIETFVSTFNCPFVSFKDDKPVLVFTHGDLLSLSERARIRAHLGQILGIPPTKQIFDIPECDDPLTESTIIEMLRYSLEHAERNFPQKSNVLDKVYKASRSLCMILMILGIGVVIAYKVMHNRHAPVMQAYTNKYHVPETEFKIKWHKIRHIW